MNSSNKILCEAINRMMEKIREKCQQFYYGLLEIELPSPSNKSECYIYFNEVGYSG